MLADKGCQTEADSHPGSLEKPDPAFYQCGRNPGTSATWEIIKRNRATERVTAAAIWTCFGTFITVSSARGSNPGLNFH